jgi:hypothetical protein
MIGIHPKGTVIATNGIADVQGHGQSRLAKDESESEAGMWTGGGPMAVVTVTVTTYVTGGAEVPYRTEMEQTNSGASGGLRIPDGLATLF